jgi:hypothetical protein
MTKLKILEDILNKYEEYLEMEGENAPSLLINILLDMLYKEVQYRTHIEKKLKIREKIIEGKNASTRTTNG